MTLSVSCGQAFDEGFQSSQSSTSTLPAGTLDQSVGWAAVTVGMPAFGPLAVPPRLSLPALGLGPIAASCFSGIGGSVVTKRAARSRSGTAVRRTATSSIQPLKLLPELPPIEEPIHTGASSTTGASALAPDMSQAPFIALPSMKARTVSGLPKT